LPFSLRPGTIIFCEYLAAPLLLTASLTAAMTLVQS
tara:strand:- start:935 stop:1042 length:108 start_codon:yes stop_codon:yes gene_type:complete